jgi:hypothetical protein
MNDFWIKTMKLPLTILLGLVLLALPIPPVPAQTAKPPAEKAAVDKQPWRRLTLGNKPWQGDFDRMVARRMIRVLMPYSRTLYFNDKGQERGITADTVRDFERYVNRKYQAGKELKVGDIRVTEPNIRTGTNTSTMSPIG